MNADFRKLMCARFLFTLGSEMQGVILGWRMYELTGSALALGLIGLTEAIPALSLALYAGYVVDRARPVKVYGHVLEGSLVSAALVLLSVRFGSAGQVAALYAASFVSGLARGFSQPAVYATVPRLVSRAELPKASAWMTSALQIARISGPAIGGLVFGFFGLPAAAGLICFALLLARGATGMIVGAPDARTTGARKTSVREELFSGLAFVFAHPILLPALSLDMVSVLFGGVTALLPIYAGAILKIGPKGLGALRAAPAVGATVTSLWLTRLDIRARAGNYLFLAVTGFGLSALVFGISRSFILSAIALGLGGAFDSVSMVIRSSAVQLASPEGMRGKISAVNSIFIGSSNELGEFESGVMAAWLGVVPSVVMGALLCLATVGIVAYVSPTLRKMDLNKI